MDLSFNIYEEDDEQSGQTATKPKRDENVVVEAIQIVRFVKSTVGRKQRDVIDNIKVSYPSMTYERALKIAKFKAEKLGNCIVVEKLERIIGNY